MSIMNDSTKTSEVPNIIHLWTTSSSLKMGDVQHEPFSTDCSKEILRFSQLTEKGARTIVIYAREKKKSIPGSVHKSDSTKISWTVLEKLGNQQKQ
jgi:hypothetical protein